jgi:UDP-N-acetylmuramoylalanine--D-glutamate ligase
MDIPVFGDLDCLMREVKDPVIAITGTNGKSTVTTLVGEMIKASGLNVAVAGNIGLPVLDILGVGVHYDAWVLELSSFQLDLSHSLSPKVATILNITPDHLDRHHTFSAYVESKHNIYQNADIILYNRDDKFTFPKIKNNSKPRVISYGSDTPKENNWGIIKQQEVTYLAKGNDLILAVDKILLKGRHNWLNALASCALAEAAGVAQQYMIDVLQRFPGLAHRSQWVRTLDNIDYELVFGNLIADYTYYYKVLRLEG